MPPQPIRAIWTLSFGAAFFGRTAEADEGPPSPDRTVAAPADAFVEFLRNSLRDNDLMPAPFEGRWRLWIL